jgi:hypothetical protein
MSADISSYHFANSVISQLLDRYFALLESNTSPVAPRRVVCDPSNFSMSSPAIKVGSDSALKINIDTILSSLPLISRLVNRGKGVKSSPAPATAPSHAHASPAQAENSVASSQTSSPGYFVG